ncbi:11515_t:CDS:2 [Ambispora leptoticha]|uniref:11515_t:CDS:1 n=1 Tax=Ambispora leptoticha TaxID=144679 RepID=A0A9N8YL21_9GLOM|nr:11515_t:CDS:2 [Ambispora leptoticha]
MPSLDNSVRNYLFQKDPIEYQKQTEEFFVVTAVHRLDKVTKGLVIYPKNSVAKRILYRAIADKTQITKKYLALCEGSFKKNLPNYVSGYLRKDSRAQKMVFTLKNPDSEAQHCALEIKKIIQKKVSFDLFQKITSEYQSSILLEVTLHTGRKHQIRSTLSFFGMPIIGDKKYGKDLQKDLVEAKKEQKSKNGVYGTWGYGQDIEIFPEELEPNDWQEIEGLIQQIKELEKKKEEKKPDQAQIDQNSSDVRYVFRGMENGQEFYLVFPKNHPIIASLPDHKEIPNQKQDKVLVLIEGVEHISFQSEKENIDNPEKPKTELSAENKKALKIVVLQRGYCVVTYDARNHGVSSKFSTSLGQVEACDLQDIINYIKEEYQPEKIGLYGFSMGAATCLF